MLQRSEETVRELREITTKTDTRDILSHATIQAEALEDYFLVDIDAHVTETQFWPEILDLIDNDVIRHMGQAVASRPGTSTALLNSQPGTLYQHVYGRIPHQVALAEAVDGTDCHHFTELAHRAPVSTSSVISVMRQASSASRCVPPETSPSITTPSRGMDAMGLDYQVVFPTPMLLLGMHPQDDIEVAVGRAYDRWLVERILPEDERVKGLLYLPFNTPRACLDIIRDFGDAPGVIGFTVCATRNKPVHHDS